MKLKRLMLMQKKHRRRTYASNDQRPVQAISKSQDKRPISELNGEKEKKKVSSSVTVTAAAAIQSRWHRVKEIVSKYSSSSKN